MLLHSNEWARVSTDSAKFETVLQQILTVDSKQEKSLKFPVFLYTLEQMKNKTDYQALRETLRSFLYLQFPIEPLPPINVNTSVGADGYKESIDICNVMYKELRSFLTANGNKTQGWIREELLPYVTVAKSRRLCQVFEAMGPRSM